MSSSSTSETTEHIQAPGQSQGVVHGGPAPAQLDVAGLSHRGLVRKNNEDHFLVVRFGRYLEGLATNIPADDLPPRHELAGHALLVADGLGGHAAGETASKSAIRILCELVLDTPDWIFRSDEDSLSDKIVHRAAERLKLVNEAMSQQASDNPELRDFGTTLTIAWGIGRDWFVAHVGDSRAYLYRRGTLHQLTRDHTVAQAMADAGFIAQQEVAFHRWRSKLTQLLGDQEFRITPDIKQLSLEDGDCLLLCSDGLPDMLSSEQIADTLAKGASAEATCRMLVDQALEAGGEDNVTAIVARVRLPAI